ncbi:hypothetical protein ONE63_006927 [Megalurothrips usitatus]|uniref:BTB domain-containing protein n=1 Tax=Megalurothrips usitatus TaxID=439358 RepID=A0AAV7XSY4_9NEOP|nr:hypothetical protein ONE63_006927 [Megalurothrips usitatus]
MRALLQFMYTGGVAVSRERIGSFLLTAEALQVKVLKDMPSALPSCSDSGCYSVSRSQRSSPPGFSKPRHLAALAPMGCPPSCSLLPPHLHQAPPHHLHPHLPPHLFPPPPSLGMPLPLPDMWARPLHGLPPVAPLVLSPTSAKSSSFPDSRTERRTVDDIVKPEERQQDGHAARTRTPMTSIVTPSPWMQSRRPPPPRVAQAHDANGTEDRKEVRTGRILSLSLEPRA